MQESSMQEEVGREVEPRICNQEPGTQAGNRDGSPAANTRSKTKTRTLTQDILLSTVETAGNKASVTPRQATWRTYPMQFMREYANAVLVHETGKLLEYRNLIQSPSASKHGTIHSEMKWEDWPRACQGG